MSLAQAEWMVATTGQPRWAEEAARHRSGLRALFADPARAAWLSSAAGTSPAGTDPLLARQTDVLARERLAWRMDEPTLLRVTSLEHEVALALADHRARLDEAPAPDNELARVLREERSDLLRRKAAWEAAREIGARLAPLARDLARARNAAARAAGYPDHYHLALFCQATDPGRLEALLAEIERATDAPYRAFKARLDERAAREYGLAAADLLPWHKDDPFFREPPADPELDPDRLFVQADLEGAARRTLAGLGLEVSGLWAKADLYERPGKRQDAFSSHLDRRGDVRVLANLRPDRRSMESLVRTSAHAAFERGLDPGLPFLLRAPAHGIASSGVSALLGRLVDDPRWLVQVLGLPEKRVAPRVAGLAGQARAAGLVAARFGLVAARFQRALYADPEADLDGLWWELVERIQLLRRPPGRHAPDWAAAPGALEPLRPAACLLGELLASQLAATLERDGRSLVGDPETGRWLRERLFAPGASVAWEELVERATGAPLGCIEHARWLSAG